MTSTRNRYRHVAGPAIHTHAKRGPTALGDEIHLTAAQAAPYVAAGQLLLVDWDNAGGTDVDDTPDDDEGGDELEPVAETPATTTSPAPADPQETPR